MSENKQTALWHLDLESVDRLLDPYFPLASFDEQLGLRVGSISVCARMPSGFLEILTPRYNGFMTDRDFDFHCEAARSDELDLSNYPNIVTQSLPGAQIHYVFRWDFIARIDLSKNYACILLSKVATPLCVDSIIRIATSFLSVARGGMLVHSASVMTDFGAFLFCGISRSGKSTVGKVSRDLYPLLTDEMTLIEKSGDGYQAWGTPFWGELQLSVNQSAPLRAAFLLSKSPVNAVEKIPLGEAMGGLMRTVMYFGQNLEVCNELLNVTLAFGQAVPIYRLQFLPDASFWEVIKNECGNKN
ncbi:MAG TPA: hypothetical protein PL011_09570 [Kiritimatiellia bacterium]|nr:hypothetical protein [Kiritimatiellia bacterium]